jgi:hypothetical protein
VKNPRLHFHGFGWNPGATYQGIARHASTSADSEPLIHPPRLAANFRQWEYIQYIRKSTAAQRSDIRRQATGFQTLANNRS